jgi:hypothetical protein
MRNETSGCLGQNDASSVLSTQSSNSYTEMDQKDAIPFIVSDLVFSHHQLRVPAVDSYA